MGGRVNSKLAVQGFGLVLWEGKRECNCIHISTSFITIYIHSNIMDCKYFQICRSVALSEESASLQLTIVLHLHLLDIF